MENAKLTTIPEFAYDAVDLARQLLVNRFQDIYILLVAQYSNSDITPDSFAATVQKLQNILTILDALLYTNTNFLLSKWIDSAKSLAHGNVTFAKFLEYNARNQITLWGPTGQNDDYASKQWAGLVGTYYLPRWTTFADYLMETKRENGPFNTTFISEQILNFGIEWDTRTWGENPGEFSGTRGNTWEIIDSILDIYG